MILQVDTEKKTIKLDQAVMFDKLFELLENMFPRGEWKQYTLLVNENIIIRGQPIYIEPYVYPYKPYRWPWFEIIYQQEPSYKIQDGLYNVQID